MRKRSNSRKTDPQRKLVYAAEDELNLGFEFRNLRETRGFVKHVVSSRFWRNQPTAPATVLLESNGDLNFSISIWPNKIRLANRHLNQKVVLHEMAHLVAGPGEGHSPKFTTAYLLLVLHFWGADAFWQLTQSFGRHGVMFFELKGQIL